ncbi:hypothetical protein ACWEPL_63805 [Nonomuraea sp. NPDC004186]
MIVRCAFGELDDCGVHPDEGHAHHGADTGAERAWGGEHSAQQGDAVVTAAQAVVLAQGDLVGRQPVSPAGAGGADDHPDRLGRSRDWQNAADTLGVEERGVDAVEQQADDVGLLLHDFLA